jgi:RND family efflux transporter MFP subunit
VKHGGGWARAAAAVGAVAGLVLLILYMAGTIGGRKVAPGVVALLAAEPPRGTHVRVERREVEDVVEWPGTVRSRTVASVAPRLLARVLEVKVVAGAAVKAGDPIAFLDDRDVRARAEQARSALAAAESQAGQGDADLARARALLERRAATDADLEQAGSRARTARAEVERARQAVAEAETLLAEAVVRAPFDGVVVERLVEPGDVAAPGRPLATVEDARRLRLEALVPERYAARATLGATVTAVLDDAGDGSAREVRATIDEIAPAADPQTRTVLVKAALPEGTALRAGTFARLRQPCGKRAALLVPAAAISRAGQLESVRVLESGAARTRNVRTGKGHGDEVEVLAGLDEGEVVLIVEGGR